MKWTKWIAAYAAIIFIGGTMQQVTTIPYPTPNKDGHEFTRDLVAGVAHKTAMEDVFAGIPMFGRYADMFNFQKAVNPTIESRIGASMIATNENKIREHGWLPALSFSAEAGELKQATYEQPIETFGSIEVFQYDKNAYSSMTIVGISHSKDNTYIIYSGAPKQNDGWGGRMYWANEKTPTDFHQVTGVGALGSPLSVGAVFCYNGVTLMNGNGGVYLFQDGAITMWKPSEHVGWLSGSFIYLKDTVYDADTNEELSYDEIDLIKKESSPDQWKRKFVTKFYNAKLLYGTANNNRGHGRFARFDYYRIRDIQSLKKLNPSAPMEKIAQELIVKKNSVDLNKIQLINDRFYGGSIERDISKLYHSDIGKYTFAISYDYKNFIDTGVQMPQEDRIVFRSHNYFYGGGYRIKLRNTMVYGNKPYIERGRPWQH